ncbi:MAG TPA: NUDIX domain-containing protein [Longimicrobiales bacterium]|nr:NUDIX domain-containing protein [Longimicrobiales bacterium]
MFEIPAHRLPEGFVETVGDPPEDPAPARPAATVVLLRNGVTGLEVLLMRRHRSSGFVPGAWVFPGGRVDLADSGPVLFERLQGLSSRSVPEPSFWTAALRELFEETGVLMARGEDGGWVAAADRRLRRHRRSLLEDEITLGDVLEDLGARLDAQHVVHIAHWVTPVVEARRYDTHFFAAAMPADHEVTPAPREMTDVAWLTPADALARFQRGELPMVFPTVKTLESLTPYASVDHALAAFRDRPVPRLLPRLVRTDGGVAIVLD